MIARAACALLLLLAAASPAAAQLQSDCRGQGSIGNAVMNTDGTITLSEAPGWGLRLKREAVSLRRFAA